MKWLDWKSTFERQKFQISAQNITIVLLALGLLCSTFFTYLAFRSKRTVIIPSVINAALEVSDTDASPNFIRTNIFYALSLVYTYTPESAQSRFQEFLISFVEASKVSDLRDMLAERLKSVQSLKISESFEAENIIFSKKGTALVKGKVFRYSLGHRISAEAIYMKVGYRLLDGNLRIISMMPLSQSDYSREQRQQAIEGRKYEENEIKRQREEQKALREEEKKRGKNPDESEEPEFSDLDDVDVPTGSFGGSSDNTLDDQDENNEGDL